MEKRGKRKPILTINDPNLIRACSACAGDYEDPNATAPLAEGESDDEVRPEEDFREP